MNRTQLAWTRVIAGTGTALMAGTMALGLGGPASAAVPARTTAVKAVSPADNAGRPQAHQLAAGLSPGGPGESYEVDRSRFVVLHCAGMPVGWLRAFDPDCRDFDGPGWRHDDDGWRHDDDGWRHDDDGWHGDEGWHHDDDGWRHDGGDDD